MNKEYLYKIEYTQNHIRIKFKNRMQIIYYAVKSKWIHTTGKKVSSAHLINPVQMDRYI